MAHIELHDICKKYGEKRILHDFNLDIEEGEFLGIKGNSGTGKTTLLNIIGLLESCEGIIKIGGQAVNSRNYKTVRAYLKERIGYLFQNFALIDDLTVYENLKIVIKKDEKKKIKEKMEMALQKVDLPKETINKKVYTLSGGEQQRVAIARLILKECDIILADEPTGSLDETNGKIIIDLLHDMNEQKKTIIMVSHDNRAFVHCSRIVEL